MAEATSGHYDIGQGFRSEIEARGWAPLGPEVYFPSGEVYYSFVLCREGTLWWSKETNEVIAVSRAAHYHQHLGRPAL